MPGLLPIKWRHGWGRMIKFFHDKVQLIYVLSISVGFHVGFQLPGYGMVKVPWGSMLGSMLVSCFQGMGEVTIRKVPWGHMLGSMLGSMLVSSCQTSFNIFHSNRFIFLSCILQSSVFGTKPCFIEIYVSYDFLLTQINIIKIMILTN